MKKILLTFGGGILAITPVSALTNTALVTNQEHHHFLLTKTDLNSITTLTGQSITADTTKTYQALIKDINQFNEFKQQPLAAGYQLQFIDKTGKDVSSQIQVLENINSIAVIITSAASDPNYTGSTTVNLTSQLIITDQQMQDYFSKTLLPLAATEPPINITATSDRSSGVNEVITALISQLKQFKPVIIMLLKGLYKEKINFDKFSAKQDVYDNQQVPVSNDWFATTASAKPAQVKIYYGDTKTTDNGLFFPIRVNLN